MTTEFQHDGRDTACEVTKPDGYFQCFVPPEYVGRITPVKEGYTFDPPMFLADELSKPIYDLDFKATAK